MEVLEKQVEAFIRRKQLLSVGKKYIVALSGGADSVCLLLVLHHLGYDIEAAHCNFKLRGSESDRDETFCEALCAKKKIPFHRVHFDTQSYARLHHVSIEMAARQLRYQYFEQLRRDIHADGICVAHHRDDSVETILLNLIRGTGIDGLVGISPSNGFLYRPLLCVSRSEIRDYLQSVQQDYVTDSTNLCDDFQRNKIRLRVLPLLEEINPSVRNNVLKAGSYLQEVKKILDEKLHTDREACVIRADEKGFELSIQRVSSELLLWELLKGYGFNSAQVAQIYAGLPHATGKMWSSLTYELLVDRDRLLVEAKRQAPFRPVSMPEEGNYVIPSIRTFHCRVIEKSPDFIVDKKLEVACLDADIVRFPLLLRRVEAADRFVPYGMRGSKLVSNYLTDHKMNRFEKRAQLVMTDATGRIIWLVDQRVDDRFKVTSDTRRILLIH